MLVIGRHHLDWGSADQPPVTPLLAALMDLIAPGSTLALRIPAILATAGAVVVAALIARELGADRRAQVLTAVAQATALWVTLAGHWLTPYTLEPVQWLVIIWLLVRWIRTREDRLLLILGVAAGIAAETKLQVLLLCAVLLLTVLITGPRELLRRPLLWVGVGVAALISLPTLIWQATQGWPQLQMGPVAASELALYGGRPGLSIALIIMAGVMGTVLVIYGWWRLLRAEEHRAHRFLAITFIVLYVFFVVTGGRPYYLNGLFGVLAAVGAVGLQRRREQRQVRWRWVAWPAAALSAVAAAALFGTSLPMATPDAGDAIARRTAEAYRSLPVAERQQTAIMGQSYIYAAYIDGYGQAYDLPTAYSSNRAYGYFDPPSEEQDQVLYVGSDPGELRPHFSEIRQLHDGGDEASIWLCSGKQQSWEKLWPQLRNLYVS